MEFKKVLEKLKGNPELAKSLAEAVGRNADASELSEILAEAGVAAEDVENLISEYQRRRGLAIAYEDVDVETLRAVAGGGSGVECTQASDCDSKFKSSDWWDSKRCDYTKYCDELYEG